MENINKDDKGKLRYDVVPASFEKALALVLSFGATKYGKDTWQQVRNGSERYYSALRRHLAAWADGELTDSESHLPHLYHVAVNALFIDYFDQKKIRQGKAAETENDDDDDDDDDDDEPRLGSILFKNSKEFRNAVNAKAAFHKFYKMLREISSEINDTDEDEDEEEEESSSESGRKFIKIKVSDKETAEKIAKGLVDTFGGEVFGD